MPNKQSDPRVLCARLAIVASAALSVIACSSGNTPTNTSRSALPVMGEDCPNYITGEYTTRDLPFGQTYRFGPNSDQIVLSHGSELVIFDLERWETDRVVVENSRPNFPAWSDKGQIFFHYTPEEPSPTAGYIVDVPWDLWMVREDGSDLQKIEYPESLAGVPGSNNVMYWEPFLRFSPDGETAILTRIRPGEWSFIAMDVIDNGDTVTLGEPRVVLATEHFNEAKDFSTDGSKLIYASSRGGEFEGSTEDDQQALNLDVYTLDLATGETTRYTRDPSWDEESDITLGDGGPCDVIAFMSDRDNPNPMQAMYLNPLPNDYDWLLVAELLLPIYLWTSFDLYIAGPEGDRGWVRRLTAQYPENGHIVLRPTWSPDNRKIMYVNGCPSRLNNYLIQNSDECNTTLRIIEFVE